VKPSQRRPSFAQLPEAASAKPKNTINARFRLHNMIVAKPPTAIKKVALWHRGHLVDK
jgi:hypothetical protein